MKTLFQVIVPLMLLMVCIDATAQGTGGTITLSGTRRLHTVTSTSAITLSKTANNLKFELVGGGGGGGRATSGGGTTHDFASGGGGGWVMVYNTDGYNVSAPVTLNVTVGAGGIGASTAGAQGEFGGNTTLQIGSGTTFTAWGGAGGGYNGVPIVLNGPGSTSDRTLWSGSSGFGRFGTGTTPTISFATGDTTQNSGRVGSTAAQGNNSGLGGSGAGGRCGLQTNNATTGGSGASGRASIFNSSILYGAGGAGSQKNSTDAGTNPGTGASKGSGAGNAGTGGNGSTALLSTAASSGESGSAGIAIISYDAVDYYTSTGWINSPTADIPKILESDLIISSATDWGTATLTINSGVTLTLTSGLLTCGSITNNGTIILNGGTISQTTIPGNVTVNAGVSIPSKTYTGALTFSGNTGNYNAAGALTFTNGLTIPATTVLNMSSNTLSVTGTLTNNGTLSTSSTFSPTGTTIGGLVVFNGSTAQTITNNTYNNLQISGAGTKTISGSVVVQGIFTASGGGIEINSGTLSLTGTLTSSQYHSLTSNLTLSGGTFEVTGLKYKDIAFSAGSTNPPFMFIGANIIPTTTTPNVVKLIPAVPSADKGRCVNFRISANCTLGNSSNTSDNFIQLNEHAYLEVGDGSSSITLTLHDSLKMCNGFRIRNNAAVNTNGKLVFVAGIDHIPGSNSITTYGFLDTVNAINPFSGGTVRFDNRFNTGRKFRFIGNPFSSNLSITDLTDDIDITGNISGGNTNNFTSTTTNNPSAFTYTESSDQWSAITGTSPTVLTPLQGVRMLIRGNKGFGLDGSANSSIKPVLRINGVPYTGDQTISLSYTSGNGWNFVTNPFLAPLDMGDLVLTSGVSDVIYTYQPGNSGYRTFNMSSRNFDWLPGASVFFRCTTSAQTITVIETSKRNPGYNRNQSNVFASLDDFKNIGNLIFENRNGNAGLSDVITFDFYTRPEATDNFDPMFDGLDLGSDSVSISVLSKDGKYLSYSKTSDLKGEESRIYPLSIWTLNSSLNGNYRITFDQFKQFDQNYKIILKDKFLNTVTDLLTTPIYDFDITDDVNSKGLNRFEIIFSSEGKLSLTDFSKIGIESFLILDDSENGKISIRTLDANAKSISVCDINGKELLSKSVFTEEFVLNTSSFRPGLYFITVYDNKVKMTRKIVIN